MTVKRSKIFKVSAVCMTVIFAFMASAMPSLCANQIPDPVPVDFYHKPWDTVSSVYHCNFPGFETGIYISSSARTRGYSELYYNNYAAQGVQGNLLYANCYCYSGIALYWYDSALSRGNYRALNGWTTTFSRFETDIEFRCSLAYDLDPTVDRYIYIWVSGYTEFQMQNALLSWYGTHDQVLKEQKLEYMRYFSDNFSDSFFLSSGSYTTVKAYTDDGYLIPVSYFGILNVSHAPLNYSSSDYVIRVPIPSTVPDSGVFGITFYNVYQGYDIDWDLFEDISDIPSWMPTQLINLFTYFFSNSPYLSFCLIVISFGLITCGIIKLAG